MPSLVPLEPQGLFTGDVESLTSHICGLAGEHSVPTTALISYIVFGVTGRHQYLRRPEELYSINGYTHYARLFSEKIAALGGTPDIALTTCLPWQGWLCLTGHALLHQHRLWCSECLRIDRAAGRRPYQRLYWCLAPVLSCAKHRRLLAYACPKCAAPQHFVPRLPFLDRCHECGADLATDDTPAAEPTPAQLWDAESTFDLISATHRAQAPPVSGSQLKDFVLKLVDELAGGSCSALGKATGIGDNSLRNWTSGRNRPAFLQLTRFFRSIHCPPSALVSGFPLIIDPALITPIAEPPLRATIKYPKDDVAILKNKLLALLKSTSASPLSLKEVARRLGRSVALLRYRYPELCEQIVSTSSAHRSSEVEQRSSARERRLQRALEECAERGIYPSDRHLRQKTGLAASDLRRQDLQQIVRKFREELRERRQGAHRAPLPDVGPVLDLREQADEARSVDKDLSIKFYVEIATSTNDPGDWAILLDLYKETGRSEEAVELASVLRQRFESIPAVQQACGSVFLNEGLHKDAALAYERALKLGQRQSP